MKSHNFNPEKIKELSLQMCKLERILIKIKELKYVIYYTSMINAGYNINQIEKSYPHKYVDHNTIIKLCMQNDYSIEKLITKLSKLIHNKNKLEEDKIWSSLDDYINYGQKFSYLELKNDLENSKKTITKKLKELNINFELRNVNSTKLKCLHQDAIYKNISILSIPQLNYLDNKIFIANIISLNDNNNNDDDNTLLLGDALAINLLENYLGDEI